MVVNKKRLYDRVGGKSTVITPILMLFLLLPFTLTSCVAKRTVIVPEYKVVVSDEGAIHNDFVKNIGDKVYFAFDSSALSKEAKNLLERQAKWLLAHPNVVAKIEGHCDERGSESYNLALGSRRAEAVRSFLIAEGISDGRISTISYGKKRPAAEGHDERAWKLNRRAVTSITIKAL
ncbi:MAG: peptidoglycan-associated lipoprotein Pal [Rickettsiaceae bacterium]